MFMDLIKRLLGSREKDYRYVLLTVRQPLTVDAIKDLSQFWTFREFVAMAEDASTRAAIMKDLEWDEGVFAKAVEIAGIHFFKGFPVVAFLTEAESIEKLSKLPCIEYAHSLPIDSGLDYLNILKGLHWIIEPEQGRLQTSVVNMSLQTLEPYSFNEKEAMNVATRILSERGILVVLAAGNYGPGENTLSPWSVAPWVVGVGAATSDGARLWEGSSRGAPDDPLRHPTVVAPGVDIVGWRSPESKVKAIDEAGQYAVATGTSFATPAVSGIAALCLEFLEDLRKSGDLEEGRGQAASQLGIDTLPATSTPAIVKRMIEDMARPMPGYGAHEVGKGFVDGDITQAYFRNFAFSNFIKVFATKNGGSQDVVSRG